MYSPVYGLALHTSSPQLGLALSNFRDDSRQQTWDLDRDLSNLFHPYLKQFLAPQKWADLAFLATARGPGSFTSTRIGIVTARTLAQQLQLPIFTVSSLAAFAWSQRDFYPLDTYLALEMPATRGQLYVGIYRGNRVYLADSLMTLEQWQQTLENLTISYQRLPTPNYLGINAPAILDLAHLDWQTGKRPHWSEALPFYAM
ncbi:tRNA (adenosine(37)-N6)-threonylcarbamoyltransferase complex dimerization subunit type 1 TsaB [Microcystis protocystis FBCC-A270]|uniref:tRNA (adenosine(37)-N6)-threonylcarbamoyltransferase complex dimerization subunit type 1 TsaB n=1 Tax=Microcystis protocystis TaxID=629747 RepID=UPI003D286176